MHCFDAVGSVRHPGHVYEVEDDWLNIGHRKVHVEAEADFYFGGESYHADVGAFWRHFQTFHDVDDKLNGNFPVLAADTARRVDNKNYVSDTFSSRCEQNI